MIADKSAATSGEDRRAAGQTCTLLLAFSGGGASELVAVQSDAGPDRAAAGTDRIERAEQPQNPSGQGVEEEVLRKKAESGVTSPGMVRIIDRGWGPVRTSAQNNRGPRQV